MIIVNVNVMVTLTDIEFIKKKIRYPQNPS